MITPDQIPTHPDDILRHRDNPSLVRDYVLNLPDGFSLFYFCCIVLNYEDLSGRIHGPLCYFLEHPKYGRYRDATVPRSWFKTSIATVGKSIWLPIRRDPNIRILIAMNTADNAEKRIHVIRQHWENNELLKAAFPELVPDFRQTRWSNSCAELRRKKRSEEGTYEAIGSGGAVVSRHYDHIDEDDLVYAKKDDLSGSEICPNQEDINKAIGWHKLVYSLFSNPAKSTLDNIGTRWAVHDLKDWIYQNEPNKFRFFRLSAEKIDQLNNPTGEPMWHERFSKEVLQDLKDSQGSVMYCTPAESPVLMSNWDNKPIKDVNVGDKIIGFTRGENSKKTRLVETIVTKKYEYMAPIVKLIMESGNTVRCTKEHKWYTGREDGTHALYKQALIGSRLMYVADTEVEELVGNKRDLALWLGGLFDGEGSCTHVMTISQSPYHNRDICNRIEYALTELGYKWSCDGRTRTDIRFRTLNSYNHTYRLSSTFEDKRRFLLQCKPIKGNIAKSLYKFCSMFIQNKDKVLDIIDDGIEPVYAIETGTSNYVVWGYASSNSTQYLNLPRDPADALFNVQWLQYYSSDEQIPENSNYATIVDLASWGDSNGVARNVIVTVARDVSNHLWVCRYDRGKFNPSQVIELMTSHARRFGSDPTRYSCYVEEVQYQKAIRHFAKKSMEDTGFFYSLNALKSDVRKGAKDMRIKTVQPVTQNGCVHIKPMMKELITEFADYPSGITCDILDCLGYAVQRKLPKTPETAVEAAKNHPFSLENILESIPRSNSDRKYPFEIQFKRGN